MKNDSKRLIECFVQPPCGKQHFREIASQDWVRTLRRFYHTHQHARFVIWLTQSGVANLASILQNTKHPSRKQRLALSSHACVFVSLSCKPCMVCKYLPKASIERATHRYHLLMLYHTGVMITNGSHGTRIVAKKKKSHFQPSERKHAPK